MGSALDPTWKAKLGLPNHTTRQNRSQQSMVFNTHTAANLQIDKKMDLKQTGLGIVQFVVFLAFQAGIFNALGSVAWLLGVVIFSVILWLIGKEAMPRRMPPAIEELWKFTVTFAIVVTAIVSLGYPLLSSMTPSVSMAQFSSNLLGFWLIVFGAAMFVTGWTSKWGVTTAVGVIWVFTSIYFITAGFGYLYFALDAGFPFIIYGLITKR